MGRTLAAFAIALVGSFAFGGVPTEAATRLWVFDVVRVVDQAKVGVAHVRRLPENELAFEVKLRRALPEADLRVFCLAEGRQASTAAVTCRNGTARVELTLGPCENPPRGCPAVCVRVYDDSGALLYRGKLETRKR